MAQELNTEEFHKVHEYTQFHVRHQQTSVNDTVMSKIQTGKIITHDDEETNKR